MNTFIIFNLSKDDSLSITLSVLWVTIVSAISNNLFEVDIMLWGWIPRLIALIIYIYTWGQVLIKGIS